MSVKSMWILESDEGKLHIISIHHKRTSGLRYVLLDFKEIINTRGHSPLLMMNEFDRIELTFQNLPRIQGFIDIKKSENLADFSYHCTINNKILKEISHNSNWNQSFDVTLSPLTVSTSSMGTNKSITWYGLQVISLSDMSSTMVHRRFSEFVSLDSTIRFYLKTRELLPKLPRREVKMFIDHLNPKFISNRRKRLHEYLHCLLQIPYIDYLPQFRAFLGCGDFYRESSYELPITLNWNDVFQVCPNQSFENKTNKNILSEFSTIVDCVLNQHLCVGIENGDAIQKINGAETHGLKHTGIIRVLNETPRPLLIGFIMSYPRKSSESKINLVSPIINQYPVDPSKHVSTFRVPMRWEREDSGEDDEDDELLPPAPSQPAPPVPPIVPILPKSNPEDSEDMSRRSETTSRGSTSWIPASAPPPIPPQVPTNNNTFNATKSMISRLSMKILDNMKLS